MFLVPVRTLSVSLFASPFPAVRFRFTSTRGINFPINSTIASNTRRLRSLYPIHSRASYLPSWLTIVPVLPSRR